MEIFVEAQGLRKPARVRFDFELQRRAFEWCRVQTNQRRVQRNIRKSRVVEKIANLPVVVCCRICREGFTDGSRNVKTHFTRNHK